MHPAVKTELDNLQIQFGNKCTLTLDDYAELYGISRRNASTHLRSRGIPYAKEGREMYISTIDLAVYKAQKKVVREGKLLISPLPADEMKRRRGFSQKAERVKYGL